MRLVFPKHGVDMSQHGAAPVSWEGGRGGGQRGSLQSHAPVHSLTYTRQSTNERISFLSKKTGLQGDGLGLGFIGFIGFMGFIGFRV